MAVVVLEATDACMSAIVRTFVLAKYACDTAWKVFKLLGVFRLLFCPRVKFPTFDCTIFRCSNIPMPISKQSKLLQELSQVQEDFFSSFGYTPPLGASAATSAATSGGVANFGGSGGGGGGFSSAVSSIPPLATGSAGGASTSTSLHTSAFKDRSRSPRWGGEGSDRTVAASVSPRARPPLRRRDLDGPVGRERGDEAPGSVYHRVGTKPGGGRSGTKGRTGAVGFRKQKAAAAAATVDGASYAFPVTASSPRAEGGGTRGDGGELVFSSAGSSPRAPGRTWRSLSPSPRAAVAGAGWPTGAVGSAR